MKARNKYSNDEWKDVTWVEFGGSTVLYDARSLEFQHDNLSTELKNCGQVDEEKHWQDVRERAAIAAMQAIINSDTFRSAKVEAAVNVSESPYKMIALSATLFADALVKQLKGE